MNRSMIIRPGAHTDLMDHYVFIALDSPAAADRFVKAVQTTFEMLADMPKIGALWNSQHIRLEGIRFYPVGGFPNHLVFYRATVDAVEILHILHGARDIATVLTSEE